MQSIEWVAGGIVVFWFDLVMTYYVTYYVIMWLCCALTLL